MPVPEIPAPPPIEQVSPHPMEFRRIQFSDAPTNGGVVRRFTLPRPIGAVRQALNRESLAAAPTWPESLDTFDLVLTTSDPGTARQVIETWLAIPPHPEAMPTVSIRLGASRIDWRPGRAWIDGPAELHEPLVRGLIDFAYFEAELRRLESGLPALEADAERDAAFAFRIRTADKPQFARLELTIQRIARLRMTYARLTPELMKGSRSLPVEGRRLFSRLLKRTDVLARLEAFSDRLEVCEDLYEGAADRITDYGWWRGGHNLELIIVVLLVIESLLMAGELIVHR